MDDFDADGKAGGNGMTCAFEGLRFQPRRVVRDYYSSVVADDEYSLLDDGENKYSKYKASKRLLLLGCVCAISVLAFFNFQFARHSVSGGKLTHDAAGANSASLPSRTPHDDSRPSCRKSLGSVPAELRSRELSNFATDCDEAKWASLLGFLPFKGQKRGLRIGLVGIDEEVEQEFTVGWATYHVFPFERSQLQWPDLFPEWINEDESPPEKCPHLPMPSAGNSIFLDAVAIKVPSCGKRDVLRLQTLLAGATVASEAGRGTAESMWVVVISPCRPLVNLFPCHELVEQEDDLWLFQVNLHRMRQLLAMPVGSCALAVLPESDAAIIPSLFQKAKTEVRDVRDGSQGRAIESRPRREAYATVLHTHGAYVCGAIVAAQSIRASGTKKDLIALLDENITPEMRKGLRQAGWQLQDIERIRNPKSDDKNYNAWNYSKFRLWQLTQFDKIIFIDADVLLLRDLDFLFDMPEISAAGNDGFLFNSGVMVLEPSNCTFRHLMDNINDIESSNGGDQGYLNEIFPWWHRVPRRLNFLKHYWWNATEEERDEKTHLFEARDPPALHAIHYLGKKPWLCYRDYDCNWNREDHHQYASDAAHQRWWDVHDSMPATLQKHCLMPTGAKASFEYSRRLAEAAAFEDEHWKRKVTDPRMHICIDDDCDWESMVEVWEPDH